MDATQQIDASFYEEEDDNEEKEREREKEKEPLAALKVFKNNYIPETEVPLYQGENVLGRDPVSCTVTLQARSISNRHAVISISVYQGNDRRHGDIEALLWDLGSLNGTRKGRLKLTPHVRYALTERDSVVLADLPCQFISLRNAELKTCATPEKDKAKSSALSSSDSEKGAKRPVENGAKRSMLPPVPTWEDEEKKFQKTPSPQKTPKKPERTLVPESDSDSDGEKGGRKPRRGFLASDSTSSDLSSPTCSTFLTPANKVIPESEDESSITPSSAVMGRFVTKEDHSDFSSGSPKPVPLNFNMDSDTDVEDEEAEVTKDECEVEEAVKPPVEPVVDPACLHMDSDTDVEDEEIAKAKSPEMLTALAQKDLVSAAARTADSEMDVEENERLKTETNPPAATKAVPEPKTSAEFHMDSDTDVEDEDVPVTIKPAAPASIPPVNPVTEFRMDSDTDAEEEKPTMEVKLLSDSETEEEEDDPFKPKAVKNLKVPQVQTEQPQKGSNRDTDMKDSTETGPDIQLEQPPVVLLPAEKAQGEFRMDSDTEEEEEKDDGEQKGPEREAGMIQSSTPRGAGMSEEEMETQAFLSPSHMFKRPTRPSLLQPIVSPGGHSQDSDDFTVAETQSFMSEARVADATLDETQQSLKGGGASPFQLGLSDSSHQEPEPEEPTQALDPGEDDWTMQPTQLYAAKNSEGKRTSATAALKQLDLEATQAYAAQTNQKEGQEGEEEDTQPQESNNTDSHRVMGETRGRAGEEDGEIVDSHPSTADTLILVRSPKPEEQTQPYALFTAQTLPLAEEEQEEEEIKRSGKGKPVDEEQTQLMVSAETSVKLPIAEEEEAHEEAITTNEEGQRNAKVEETQPIEPEVDPNAAEPQPIGEDHEEVPCVTTSSRSPQRARNVSKDKETQPVEPEDDPNIAETPMDEDAKEHEHSEATSSRRPHRGRRTAIEETQPLEPEDNTNVDEAQPIDKDDLENRSASTSSRGSFRERKTAVEETQPLETEDDTNIDGTPMDEIAKEREEELSEAVSSSKSLRGRTTAIEETQPLEPEDDTNITETPMDQDAKEREEELSEATSSRRPRRGRKTVVEETQPLEDDPNITETPMDQDAKEREEELSEATSSRRPRRGRKTAFEETQPLDLEACTDAVAETQPVGEDKEEHEEEQSETASNRRPRRGRKTANVEEIQPLQPKANVRVAPEKTPPIGENEEKPEDQCCATKSSKKPNNGRKAVKTEDTQPLVQDEEEREEELTSRRPRRGRKTAKLEEPHPKGEDVEAPEGLNEAISSKRPQRGTTTKTDSNQPLKSEAGTHMANTDTKPLGEAEEGQEEEQQGRESSKRGLKGKGRGTTGRGRGKVTAEKEGLRKRGRAESDKDEDSEEEGLERKGRGRKSMRQKVKEKAEKDRLEPEEDEQRETQVEREQEEQKERDRLESERLKQEQKESKERERLAREERERIEKEKNERLEKEREEVERLEKEKREREEKERLEKERREREEKERLEKEKKDREEKERKGKEEMERLENEKKVREEKERLEKEKKETQVQERLEKEKREQEELQQKLENERKEQEEKEKQEQIEKEEKKGRKMVKEEGVGKGKVQGRRRAVLLKKEEEKKLENESEDAARILVEKQETAEHARGRRTTRKSTAPPPGVEESLDVPAKRTRSRSNSSNSVSSERSVSTLEDQTGGRSRGRGRKTGEEMGDCSKPSSRRKTSAAPSNETLDTKQDSGARTRSRSNSGSSERSRSSAGTQNKGKGGRGRKSMKVEKPDEEGPREPVAAGRGRGKGAKRTGAGAKQEETEEAQQDKSSDAVAVHEDRVMSPTPSRGRKRSADSTVQTAESPQPTLKTPRRSTASQTYKVLFTGVVDEDGEKALVRLGGGLAKGVGDMTHLVTDKVRRTVKFLCAVARGVPIVTPDWLTKSGKAGTFLSPNEFLVKDVEQEKKFNFSLKEALRAASHQPLLQGYEIHATPSVKPEPCQMKDIITCCGARYLPKMPSAQKAQMVVVVSCDEDKALCNKALSASVPVVSAEFLLTGILQQKVDLKTFLLSASAASKPATQGRRK